MLGGRLCVVVSQCAVCHSDAVALFVLCVSVCARVYTMRWLLARNPETGGSTHRPTTLFVYETSITGAPREIEIQVGVRGCS